MNSIDSNRLLKTIKRNLGIRYFTLPVEDEELLDVIENDSLTTFSTYFPNSVEIIIDTDKYQMKKIYNKTVIYLDNDLLGGDIDIIGVSNVSPDDTVYSRLPEFDGGMSFDLFGEMQIASDYADMVNSPIISTFKAPNQLILDEYVIFEKLYVTLLTTHPKSLHTIELGYLEEFKKLCMLDLKIFLFQILKHYDKIDTTFGQIDLRIDEWSDAESKRESLIETWNDKFMNNRVRKIYKV